MLDAERVLVLGSNSFSGSHLIARLLDKTECRVFGVSRSEEYDPVFLPYLYRRESRPDRYRFQRLDVNGDIDSICSLCDEFHPDAVVNYAAQGEVRNSWRWPEQWYQTNCMSVVKLAEFLKDKTYLKRYVAVSTPEVYGTTCEKLRETDCYRPSTPYAASKLAGDLHLMAYCRRYGFPVVFTRSANVFGMHQQLYRIIPRVVIYIKTGKKLDLHGRGLARRAFVHVGDAADLTARAIACGMNGEVYHVAPDEEPRRICDVVALICRMMNRSFEDCVTMVDEDFGQDAVFSLDASKAKKQLGWKPRVSFEEGVAETIKWIEDNWEKVKSLPWEYVHKK